MSDTPTPQLRECACGTLTNADRCPDCGACPYPLWTVHTLSGRCVGYVAATFTSDAITSIQQSPQFDRYKALQPRPCHATPEQGPLATA